MRSKVVRVRDWEWSGLRGKRHRVGDAAWSLTRATSVARTTNYIPVSMDSISGPFALTGIYRIYHLLKVNSIEIRPEITFLSLLNFGAIPFHHSSFKLSDHVPFFSTFKTLSTFPTPRSPPYKCAKHPLPTSSHEISALS